MSFDSVAGFAREASGEMASPRILVLETNPIKSLRLNFSWFMFVVEMNLQIKLLAEYIQRLKAKNL